MDMTLRRLDLPHQAIRELPGVGEKFNAVSGKRGQPADPLGLQDHRLIRRPQVGRHRVVLAIGVTLGIAEALHDFPVPLGSPRPQPALAQQHVQPHPDVRMQKHNPQPRQRRPRGKFPPQNHGNHHQPDHPPDAGVDNEPGHVVAQRLPAAALAEKRR